MNNCPPFECPSPLSSPLSLSPLLLFINCAGYVVLGLLTYITAASPARFFVNEMGHISLTVNTGAPPLLLDYSNVFFNAKGRKLALQELQLSSISQVFSGQDSLGNYAQQNVEWKDTEGGLLFQTNVKDYYHFYVFQQRYVNDTTGTSAG
jgi:hypothetical protein